MIYRVTRHWHVEARNVQEALDIARPGLHQDARVETLDAAPQGITLLTGNEPSITCPVCGITSHHPKDISERYCGRCHRFHEDMTEATHGC